MTNQEQYELICEKAKKYDRLVDVLDKIISEIKTDTDKWWYGVNDDCFMKLSDVLQIIYKYKPESEDKE